MPDKALLIVDVQNDFCEGGALAVQDGDAVVPVLNKYIDFFKKRGLPVFATRDWHPKNSRHFREFGGQWPPHCVQNTRGAAFHPGLKLPEDAVVVSGGAEPSEDGYSAFDSSDLEGRDFPGLLKSQKIEELFVGGIATDYCVKASVLDALKEGFKVKLLTDAIKGVNLRPDDSEKAIDEMIGQGAEEMTFEELSGKGI